MKYVIIIFTLIIMGTASLPVYSSELDDLKELVQQLKKRIEQLESKQKLETPQPVQTPAAQPEKSVATQSEKPIAAAQPVQTAVSKPSATEPSPGSFKIPGTETSIKIYGSARFDATYDFGTRNNDTRNNDWSSAIFAQPLDTNSANRSRKGQFYATARASRFGIVSNTPTPLSPLEIKLEADFNAPNDYMGELASNSTMFRLRHAYGQLGNFLAGQTWSNFIDLRSYPETVDFNPTGDVTLIRQAQVRYTIPMGSSSLSFSIENPESLTKLPPVQTLSNGGRNDFDRVPDFTANWIWNGKDTHLSARAATLEYRNDLHNKRGYALALGGSGKIGSGTLVAGVQGGSGIGRYMFNSIMQGATETGVDLKLWKAIGWHLGYTLPWTSKLRSNFIVSQTMFGADRSADAFMRAAWLGVVDEFIPNKRVEQALVNLFWAPVKNVEAGLEYSWGRRFTFGPEEGTQQRINTMVQYSFP